MCYAISAKREVFFCFKSHLVFGRLSFASRQQAERQKSGNGILPVLNEREFCK
jgi:hypothetical protein